MNTNQVKIADGIELNRKMLTGMFADRQSTEKAYKALEDKGSATKKLV